MSPLSAVAGLFRKGAPALDDRVVVTIARQPISVGAVRAAFPLAEKLVADARAAFEQRFPLDADFLVLEDATDIAALVPIAAPYAPAAKALLIALNYALDHPASVESEPMRKAQGPENVTL